MSKARVLTGVVLDEQAQLTLTDLCRSCAVRQETIIALLEEGILTPSAHSERDDRVRFPASSVKRAMRALRLQKELELDLAGVALALDLLDEIERLRNRLRDYEDAFG